MPARLRHALPLTELPAHVERLRLRLADGAQTTVHVARYDPRATAVRLVRLPRPEPLEAWCRREGVDEALVGGFYARPGGTPLGELRTRGLVRASVPFEDPWGELRACVHLHRGRVTIARRPDLPAAPRGDLLQAGPLLVRGGAPAIEDGVDSEGFSAGAGQFDSDITAGRYPPAPPGGGPGAPPALTRGRRAHGEGGPTPRRPARTPGAPRRP